MSALVQRLDLRTRARKRANMENSTFWADADVNTQINIYVAGLYDMLVEAGPPDYFSADATIVLVSGTVAYALPSDFRSLQEVFSIEGADFYRPLEQINDKRRLFYRAPQSAGSVLLRYTPAPPLLTADTGAGGVFDGVSGWDEWIVCSTARAMLIAEESDVTELNSELGMLGARISAQAKNRNQGGPNYMGSVDDIDNYPYPYANTVNAYTLRAGFLDIFSLQPVYP